MTDQPNRVRLGRLALSLALLTLASSTAFLTWWTTTLSGLPDVGDPFDVSAFADVTIPDDDNAYVLYKRALARIGTEPDGMKFDWAAAGPIEKGWLDRNEEALELWRQGTERPNFLYMPTRSLTLETLLPVVQEIRKFSRLAKLEGGRLEAEGDLEGAWQWHRAIFRSSRHVGHRATLIERAVGLAMHNQASRALIHWSKDPKMTAPMIRRALDAAIADDAMTGSLSDNIKVEYLLLLKTYDDPDLVRKFLNVGPTGAGFPPAWFARNSQLFGVLKTFKKEPERSKRVGRLIFANLLATFDRPPDRRPVIACSLPNGDLASPTKTLIDLYNVDDSSLPSARTLSPDQILQWFNTTLYARHLMPAFSTIINAIERERTTQANLLIALAARLYELDRGKPPETTEELVGPYLKALPEGYKPPEPTTTTRTSP